MIFEICGFSFSCNLGLPTTVVVYFLMIGCSSLVSKAESGKRESKYDVLQGSVLGPLLHIIFNNLHKVVEFSTVH